MIVTPVSVSPARMAAATGEAPRQRGSSEAWTFTQPWRASSRIGSRRMWPKAATTITSGSHPANWETASAVRSVVGW
jgi:hypothetical protein